MGYFAVWGIEGGDEVDADDVATNSGLMALIDWAEDHVEDYPKLACLAGWGRCRAHKEGEDALAKLEAELAALVLAGAAPAPAGVQRTLKRLLKVVRGRPAGAVYLLVTDGAE